MFDKQPLAKELYEFHASPLVKKNDIRYGATIAKKLMTAVKTNSANNYYTDRNNRFDKNRRFARGAQDMKEFLSMMNIDGKKAFVNLDMKPPAIAPKFMEVLISRFMERQERPTVRGVDKVSAAKKQERKDRAEFRMNMGGEIAELQQKAGIQLEDPNAYTPDSYEDMELYFEIEDRSEEEVKFEKIIQDTIDDNNYDVFKRNVLFDLGEVGMAVAYVYKDSNGNTKFFRAIPEDCIYGYSNYDDFRDCTVFGVLKKLKVTEVREMFSGKVDEKDLYDMYASTVQDGRIAMSWTDEYRYMLLRPYDDAVIELLFYEIVTNDKRMWVSKTDNFGKVVVDEKRERPQRLGDNKNLIEKDIRVVYKGCYNPTADKMLQWEMMENMIKPHYALHEVFTNFVIVMPNNRDMRNMAIIERMETSIRMMSLIHLKIQQLIAKMRPDGLIINVRGLTGVNLGLGENDLTPMELESIYDQTGNVYTNDLDEDGETRNDIPIRPLENNSSVSKLNTLIESYNFYLQRLRDDIGTNEYVEGQGVNPKLGLGVLNNQVAASNRATEFIYNSYITLLEGVAKRIAVLEWFNVVQGKYPAANPMDYTDFIPDLHIEMMPTDADRQYLESITQSALTAQLITLEEAFKVRRLAKTSVKLAEMYLAKYEGKRQRQKEEQAARSIQENGRIQQQTQAMNLQGAMQKLQVEYQGKSQVQKLVNEGDKIKSFGGLVKDLIIKSMELGKPIPDQYAVVVNQYLQMMMGTSAIEAHESEMEMMAMQQQMMQGSEQVDENGGEQEVEEPNEMED